MGRKAINQYSDFNGNPSEVNILVQEKSQVDPTLFEHKKADFNSILNKKISQVLIEDDTEHVPSVAAMYDALSNKEDLSDAESIRTSLTSVLSQLRGLIKNISYTGTNNANELISSIDDAILAMGGTPINRYNIIRSLTGCIISNNATVIDEDESYHCTVTSDKGYSITNIQIIMNGTDITSTAWDSRDNYIDIASVTGDVHITATAVKVIPQLTYSIVGKLTYCSLSNTSAVIRDTYPYESFVNVDEGYELDSIVITMGGVDVTGSTWDPSISKINIASVTGSVIITAVAKVPTYTITKELTECTLSNTADEVVKNESYTSVVSVEEYYDITTITITMGGADITLTSWNPATNTISINSVTGNLNILITATTQYTIHTIDKTLTNCTMSNQSTKIVNGSSYASTLVAVYGYKLDEGSVSIKMDNVDITSTAWDRSLGTVTINSVTGDIVILATGTMLGSFTINKTLTDCTLSNPANTVIEYGSYSSLLSGNDGRSITSILITMNGSDITQSAWDANTGAISIPMVSGNVFITAVGDYILPAGYTRLTYVATNSFSQYIDTGIPENATRHAEYKVMMTDFPSGTGKNSFVLTGRTTTFPTFRFNNSSNKEITFKYRNTESISSGNKLYDWQLDTEYVLEGFKDKKVKINGVELYTTDEPAGTSETKLYLFTYGYSPGNTGFKGRLYYAKIWKTDESGLLRNYIPCKNSNDEVGLYDFISQEFFTASGGSLIPGDPV